jgi:penicillin-binding protein 2
MNPNNGEVLAMASSPGFDPNDFIEGISEADWKGMVSSKDRPLQPRAVAGQYPPGSVFKIVVALAGLEEGIINPQEEITCTGRYTMGSRTYRCWRRYGHGRIDFHRALVESCDVYFYRVGRRLGVDKIGHFARMCGLGKPTDFELGCEKMGLIPTRQWKLKRWGTSWQPGETISTAIGQSFVLVTPVQTARLISAVFNGGYLYRPKVIKWIGKKGKRLHTFSPQVMGELKAKQENLELIKNALIGVVNEPQGTATMARIEEISVAGKTGTAQVVNLETGKLLGKGGEIPLEFRDHAWFAAVAPAAKPSLALAIIVEHGGHGGSSAAPIARQLIAAYLGKY